jgi:hypothetical protein
MEDLKPLYEFFEKWQREVFAKVQLKTPVKSGRLKKSEKIGITKIEDGLRSTLQMIYYGHFVDQGTKYIEARHFSAPMQELDIPKLEKEFAKYTEIEVATFIENLNKNKR